MGEGRTDRQMIEWLKRTNKRMAEKMNKSINKNKDICKLLTHIYQGERDLQDENRAFAIPGGVQVNKEIAMSSGQFSQVKNSLNTRIYYH